MSDYAKTLTIAKKSGASNATDAGVMALFCDSRALQMLCGAVSAKLVFDGAQSAGLTAAGLAQLAADSPSAVHDLMWQA